MTTSVVVQRKIQIVAGGKFIRFLEHTPSAMNLGSCLEEKIDQGRMEFFAHHEVGGGRKQSDILGRYVPFEVDYPFW